MGHSVAGDRVLHLHQSKNHKFFPEVFGEAHKEERSGYPDYLCTNDQGGAVVYRELDHCRNRVLYADLLHLSTPYVGDAVHSWNLRLVLYQMCIRDRYGIREKIKPAVKKLLRR